MPRSVQRRRLRQFRLINAAKRLRKKKRESRVWFSPFAQLAKAHPNPLVYEPRVSAVFRWQMPCGDDVSHGPFSEQLSEKNALIGFKVT